MILKKIEKFPKELEQLNYSDRSDLIDKLCLEKGHIHFYMDDEANIYAILFTECMFIVNQDVILLSQGKYLLSK